MGLLALSSAGVTAAGGDFMQKLSDKVTFTAHGNFVAGVSSGEAADLATHGHDPNQDRSIQGIDFGLSLRANDYVEGFINGNLFLDAEDKMDTEWEEGFLKLKNLPGGFELRGGRYLNRLGTQNNVHLHGWRFVDADLATGLFLGEDGLRTEGVELSWVKPYDYGNFILSGSYGNALEHVHEEDHSGHSEAEETTEKSFFNGELLTLRAQFGYNADDFNYHTVGLNYATGENGFGRDSELFSVDYQYQWRENGLEAGGKEWLAGVEYMQRDVEWVDEMIPSLQGETSQKSVMVKVGHTFADDWNLTARYGRIQGVTDGSFVTDERRRLSLALTHSYTLSDQWNGYARLQYNHDELQSNDSEDSLWLQLGVSFGAKGVSEVR